jgi:hypothetical protein
MEQQSRPKGRPPGALFPRRLLVYDDDDGMALLAEIARTLGVSKAAAVRLLVRERAQQLGLRSRTGPRGRVTSGGQRGPTP